MGTLMRDDENASSPKKKVSRAFYPELLDEVAWFDSWYSLQKTRREEEAEEGSEEPRSGAFLKRRDCRRNGRRLVLATTVVIVATLGEART
jgi:hypothetical protein